MVKKILMAIIILFSLSFAYVRAQTQESLTITTYYPSPYGSYRELTAYQMKIGRTFSGSDYNIDDDNLIVEGRVGIGTTTPAAKLDVAGDINFSGNLLKNGNPYPSFSCIRSYRSSTGQAVTATCPAGYNLTGGSCKRLQSCANYGNFVGSLVMVDANGVPSGYYCRHEGSGCGVEAAAICCRFDE